MSDEDVCGKLDKERNTMKLHWGYIAVVALIAFAIAAYWNPVTLIRAKAGV